MPDLDAPSVSAPRQSLRPAAPSLADRPIETPPGIKLGSRGWTLKEWGRQQAAVNNPSMFVGPPSPEQIKQGAFLGDCLFLSVIGAVTTVAPHVVQRRMRKEGNRVEVTLFDGALGSNVPHVLSTNVLWYENAQGSYQAIGARPVANAWWVSMLEKGLAAASRDGYASIAYGTRLDGIKKAMEQLTGNPAEGFSSKDIRDMSTAQLGSHFAAAVGEGRPVVVGLRRFVEEATGHLDLLAGALSFQHNAVLGHGYWLRGYDAATQMVSLGNPWGRRHLELPLADFQRMASRMVIGTVSEHDRGA